MQDQFYENHIDKLKMTNKKQPLHNKLLNFIYHSCLSKENNKPNYPYFVNITKYIIAKSDY